MHVRMGLLNKKEDWSSDRFRTYWREQHSKLASQLPGLKVYHQNHVTDASQRGISYKRGPESVDGISQLWFDDPKGIDSAFSETFGKQLMDDENHFIGHLRIVTATPIEVIPPPPRTALKRMSFLRRRADVTAEVFAHEWNVRHAALVKTLPGVLGYRQNLVTHRESPKGQVVGYEDLPIDGIVELWFENTETLNAAFASPQGVATMQHATTFIDEITTFLVEPVVVV
ncbi:MAG: hypothetical protein RJA09_2627 [Pseudomonadota bacterium]|jgi:uncharacterized protein (TIGR02118 family)